MSSKNTNTVAQAEKRTKLLKEAKIAEKAWQAACKMGNKEYAKIVKVELEAMNNTRDAAWKEYLKVTKPTVVAYENKREIAQKAFDRIVKPFGDKAIRADRALKKAS